MVSQGPSPAWPLTPFPERPQGAGSLSCLRPAAHSPSSIKSSARLHFLRERCSFLWPCFPRIWTGPGTQSRGHSEGHLSWRPLAHWTVRVLGPRDGGSSVLKASSAAARRLGQMTGLPEFCLHICKVESAKTQHQKAQGPGSGVKLASAHSC